jgi:hypothetical protein
MKKHFLPVAFLYFGLMINLSAQTISGTVISELSEPLGGVSIVIPHTNIGTCTDNKGNYSITINSNNRTLCFSLIGYESQEIDINKDTIINITLEESPIELSEIIVIGVNVRKKSNIHGVLIERNGLFGKPDTIIKGLSDTTFNRLEAERTRKILDSINLKYLMDSINDISNISSIEKYFRKYMIDTVKYPDIAINNGIYGNLYAIFTINKESQISDIKILRGLDPLLDNEILSVLQKMPNHIQIGLRNAGANNNRKVPKFVVKIRFELIEL